MASLDYEEFDRLFTTFEHTAFRLEPRESYAGVTYDRDDFSRFLAGKSVDWQHDRPWTQNIAKQTKEGKRIGRVRVVSEPWSDYTRYGVHAALGNVVAGEDIRYLPRPRGEELGLPVTLPGYDYWLFDSKLVVALRYEDHTNDLVRIETVADMAHVVQHNYWRDAAWHHAIPLIRYAQLAGEPLGPLPSLSL